MRRAIGLIGLYVAGFAAGVVLAAERINHEGRILGPFPSVTNATLFNTPEADAVMSALQIFPRDHAWNEDVSTRPVLANSAAMLRFITTNLAALGTGRTNIRAFQEMNFVLVPSNQAFVPINFVTYPSQSDASPYPIPANMPVEGWPTQTGSSTLDEWQRDINNSGGDRHSIIIQPSSGGVWETWQARLNVSGSGSNWQAANGALWSLNNNALRPAGWTSGDAAGLSMLGGLVRYDECQRGMVEHAIRLIVRSTRRAYIYPATHHASVTGTTNPDVPAMGERLRLKSSFVIPSSWAIQEKAVARALQKYGAIVADNGSFFSISVVPDSRWASNPFRNLTNLTTGHFEVIQTTGATEGPRSPGAPSVNAGADLNAAAGVPVQLNATVNYSHAAPLATEWRLYSGPGAVSFDDGSRTNARATFPSNGVYTLVFRASNGVHTPAYDAAVVTVSNGIRMNIERSGSNVLLRWTGGTPPYTVESSPALPAAPWSPATNVSTNNVQLNTNESGYFRVRGS